MAPKLTEKRSMAWRLISTVGRRGRGTTILVVPAGDMSTLTRDPEASDGVPDVISDDGYPAADGSAPLGAPCLGANLAVL
jgi:hypothetical protein